MSTTGKRNKTGLYIIIFAIILLIIGGLYVFFGTDLLKGKEKDPEESEKGDNKDDDKDKTANSYTEDKNGVYESGNSVLKLYGNSKGKVYIQIDTDSIGIEDIYKYKNGKLEKDFGESDVVINFIEDGVELTSHYEGLETGIFSKKSGYTIEEFYKDMYGDPELLKTKYNGVYQLNNNTTLYMMQYKEDEVDVDVSAVSMGSYKGFNTYFVIQEDGTLKESLIFDDDVEEKFITMGENEVKLELKDEEDQEVFGGTYTKKSDVTVEYAINRLLGE